MGIRSERRKIKSNLHVRLEIVFASTAEGTQRTLMAFQACVDDHVSLPVALAFDDQATHRTLEWFATILRRALMGTKELLFLFFCYSFFYLEAKSSPKILMDFDG